MAIISQISLTPLAQGIFPSSWKQAKIIALKKKIAPLTASDFRPIALLYFLSKVLEKIAHHQITEYLNSNNLLDPLQVGFRRHHSTRTTLLKLTDEIRMAIYKKKVTLLLLFDFSKTFDSVSPSKLLRKLRQLGFSRSALLWIKSYLQGRSQMVITNKNGNSDWLETNLGVPHGSVLSPLPFCIYVNNLRDILDGRPLNISFMQTTSKFIFTPPKIKFWKLFHGYLMRRKWCLNGRGTQVCVSIRAKLEQ